MIVRYTHLPGTSTPDFHQSNSCCDKLDTYVPLHMNASTPDDQRGPFLSLFLLWLGVTRASEPPVPCGDKLSCCLTFSMLIRKGMVSCAATTKIVERVLASEVQSHSREWLRPGG